MYSAIIINSLYSGNHLTSIFAISEDPDEMIMLHFITFYTVCKGKKRSGDKRIQSFLENYNRTPLYMYNGLSHVYCIKPEGRIHWYTKG